MIKRKSEAKAAPARGKRRRPGVGLVLVGLFVGSVAIRLVGGTAEAIAREVGDLTPERDSAAEGFDDRIASSELDAILTRLRDREAELERRQESLDLREQDLEAIEAALQDQLAALEAAEAELRGTMALAETAAENDVAQLTSVYATMKPKEAAAIFEEMAPEFAAGFLARMEPEAAAAIIAGLTPSTAHALTVMLAGRHVNVPTQ